MPAFRYSQEEWQADLRALDMDAVAFTGPNPLQKLNGRWKAAMARVHPDKGGTDEEAKAVNVARDRLREWFKLGMPQLAPAPKPKPPPRPKPQPKPQAKPRPEPPPPPPDPPPQDASRDDPPGHDPGRQAPPEPDAPADDPAQEEWPDYKPGWRERWDRHRSSEAYVWLRYILPAHARAVLKWRRRRYLPIFDSRSVRYAFMASIGLLLVLAYGVVPTLNRWAWEAWKDDPHRYDNPDAPRPAPPPVERKAAPERPFNIPAPPRESVAANGQVTVAYDFFPPGFTPAPELWMGKYKGNIRWTTEPAYARDYNLVQVNIFYVTMDDDWQARNNSNLTWRGEINDLYQSMADRRVAKIICWYSYQDGKVSFVYWWRQAPPEAARLKQIAPRIGAAKINGATAACPTYRRVQPPFFE